MKKLVILGAGGHARSVLDIIQQEKEYEVIGCLDPCFEYRKSVEYMEHISVIGNDEAIPELRSMGIENVFVAIGNNTLRKKLIQKVKGYSLKLVNVISSYAYISPSAQIGVGTCVMPGGVINVNCRVGEGVIINTNASVDHECNVGNYVHVAPGTAVSGSVMIGESTHIGTGSSVIDGICIGKESYIGAGAAVVKDIPDKVMAYGVPAKIIRKL